MDSPPERAFRLFESHGVECGINYSRADVTDLPFACEQFDVVSFKSLLGAAGRYGGVDSQKRVLAEAHRVLKPNGVLLFAENATEAKTAASLAVA